MSPSTTKNNSTPKYPSVSPTYTHMNLTLQEVRERIDWLLNNTTVMPTARTNVADINLVNGVGREAHFVAADGEGNTIESLLKQVRGLEYDLMNEREEHRTASVID